MQLTRSDALSLMKATSGLLARENGKPPDDDEIPYDPPPSSRR